MAIDSQGNGVAYDRTAHGFAYYRAQFAGDTVFWAVVNENDHALAITIWPAYAGEPGSKDGAEEIIVTKAHAAMSLHSYPKAKPEFEGDVEVREHVDGMSVQEYVLPRFPWLLAAVLAGSGPTQDNIMKAIDANLK